METSCDGDHSWNEATKVVKELESEEKSPPVAQEKDWHKLLQVDVHDPNVVERMKTAEVAWNKFGAYL